MNITFLKECDKAYYNTGNNLISDAEYDALKDQLREEYPNDPYFKTVGAPVAGASVSLPYILGSLTKTKPDGSLLKWCHDNNLKQLVLSDKLDGVSVYARYVDGILEQASTRGNGYEGKDITEKVRLIAPTCNGSGVQEFRGEGVMTQDDCDSLGYSLPRSAVAGIFNNDEIDENKCKKISIIFYNTLGKELPVYTEHYFEIHKAGLNLPVFCMVDVDENLESEIVKYYQERKDDSEWDIDGIVCANQSDASIGEDYYPANMVAFKVNEESVRCVVTDIVWEIKRSGKLQPVVHFEPVKIGGSNVTKATGFNRKFIVVNNIHIGSEIGIVKSGDIIPYITECYTKDDGYEVDEPTNCPACGEFLDSTKTGVDLVCINSTCEGQMLYKIEHFLLSHDVEEITATTIKRLGVKSIKDLYNLTEGDISSIEGMGSKRAKVILKELQKTLDTTQEKLLKSFGISGIGNTASDMIVNKFGDIDTLFDKNVNDFKELDGFGEVLARNLVNGLNENKDLYMFLKSQGLKFEEKKSMDLQGKVFCLTGKSDISRNDLMQMIGSHGGMVKGISKKVDFVVTNDTNSTSSKMKKAIQYGIPIISYDELLNIIS